MLSFDLVLTAVVFFSFPVLTTPATYTMGYITGSERRAGNMDYPRPGLTISGAISLAVDEINSLHPLVDGHLLNFSVSETYGEEEESIRQVAILWTRSVAAYIGPQETCVHEAKMASGFNLPMISYFCSHSDVSNKNEYPTFARTRPSSTQISSSVASLLLTFRWRTVAFLHSGTLMFQGVVSAVLKTLQGIGVEVKYTGSWSYVYHYGYGENPFDQLVEESYRETRIYLLLGYDFEHLGLMMSLQKRGLLDAGEYFVVGIDIEQYDNQNPTKYFKGLLRDEMEEDTEKAFRSYLGVVSSPPVGFDNFARKVNQYMQMPPFYFPNPVGSFGGIKNVPAEGAYLYDAVYVFARALNECLINNDDPRDGKGMMKYLTRRTYFSAMGYMVYMDENGDAEGNYTLVGRRPTSESLQNYGLFPVGVFQLPENRTELPVLKFLVDIEWIGKNPPADEPICGFHGNKCVMWKIAAAAFGIMMLGFAFIIMVTYRNWSYEQELDSLLWKIDFKDIQITECTPSNANKISRNLPPLFQTSQVSLSSNVEGDFRYATIYTTVCTYRGRVLAVKQLRKKTVDLTRQMKKELKTMRDLRHDNLNPFIGACIESPNICIVTEYCSRGSLKDILENEDVKLDNMFHASLLGDIIRGMNYLHESPLHSHGNLKSSNCLVDSRWVVRVADFGLHELKYGAEPVNLDTDIEKQWEKLLWRAPELLRDPKYPARGTQKGDVYSFGILLYEMIGRKGPFGQVKINPSEIVRRVACGNEIPFFRPQTEKLKGCFDCTLECMQECWAEDPDRRPDFKTIRSKLRPMRRGMKPNIFDNILSVMEKYANNLEALVDERTDQLYEEKRKTDALLYEMLPKYVADQLKRGHKVQAESFDCVTIYFSDIVGFTTMSAESSPLEVVDFLNDLYTCFDSILEHYDVYKVETIGDAYMVASGLPIRNGERHAAEVASMALHLLEEVKHFRIRHLPREVLQLRVGIHSGAVCAGVVGQKMPRYCLFGDTVNTASRMESTGLPLRIHCSKSVKDLLDKLGGYYIEERGITYIKGKGDMQTYWIIAQTQSRKKNSLNASPLKDSDKATTRSSLKKMMSNKSFHSRRMVSGSPKKLRFAEIVSKHVQKQISSQLKLTDTHLSSDRIVNSNNQEQTCVEACKCHLEAKWESCPNFVTDMKKESAPDWSLSSTRQKNQLNLISITVSESLLANEKQNL